MKYLKIFWVHHLKNILKSKTQKKLKHTKKETLCQVHLGSLQLDLMILKAFSNLNDAMIV